MHKLKLISFTKTPGPRFREEGNFSAQEWLEDHLLPAFEKAVKEKSVLIVDLDGADGFSSSFIEEAFCGLIKTTGLLPKDISRMLDVRCNDEPSILEKIKHDFLSHY